MTMEIGDLVKFRNVEDSLCGMITEMCMPEEKPDYCAYRDYPIPWMSQGVLVLVDDIETVEWYHSQEIETVNESR